MGKPLDVMATLFNALLLPHCTSHGSSLAAKFKRIIRMTEA
jgi:hypothetical protein